MIHERDLFFFFFTTSSRRIGASRSLDNEWDNKFPFTQGVAFNNFVLGHVVLHHVLCPTTFRIFTIAFQPDCYWLLWEERNQETLTTRGVFLLNSENLLNDNSYSSLNFIFPLVLCNNSLRGCEERWSIEVVNWSCFGVTGKHIEGFEGLKEKIVVEEEKGVD